MACEVLEVSGNPMTQIEQLREVHFIVIHHADAANRETLSLWLKANSGTEVRFTVAGHAYHGVLRFDASKPDGTPQELLDVSRLHDLGWQTKISLEDGIRQASEWYLRQRP
jgi:nucleoside-diphosphate-sugar epimerase